MLMHSATACSQSLEDVVVAGEIPRSAMQSQEAASIFVIRHHPISGNLKGLRVGLLAAGPFYSRLSMSSTEPTEVAEGKAAENSLRRS